MFPWCSTGDIIYADNAMGAVFGDPSGGTAHPPNLVGVPAVLTYVSCFRYTDPDTPTFPGFLSGSWYSQALNNTVVSPSTGLAVSFSGQPPANATMQFGGQVMLGNIVRRNTNVNIGNGTAAAAPVPFTLSLGPWAGVSVVEHNVNLTTALWDNTGSVAAVMRGNSNGNATAQPAVYACGAHNATPKRCGAFPGNATADCAAVCGPGVVVIP
jgi:hypothetical protein